MVKQLELDLSERANRKRVAPKLAARMIAMLTVRGGWVKRWEFQEVLGLKDRECRLGRRASHGRIIQGQLGYKLAKNATAEEISKALMAIQRQIQAEQEEYRIISRRAHEQIHRGAE